MSSPTKNTVPQKRVNGTTHYPSQINHDIYFIPESVRQYADEPLYILVAWWCLQQQDWLRRHQIAETFHITLRRASYLMAYLRSKTKRVKCETREALMANNVYRYEIMVTQVLPAVSRKKGSPSSPRRTRSRIGNADTSQLNMLWNQLSNQRRAMDSDHKEENEDD